MEASVASLNPLGSRIAERIRLSGPLSVADFMAVCLGDPEHGYYMHRDPLGLSGDFVTAPEVSQMFGELIGLWAIEVWERAGRPKPFALVELGPGRGTLMRDALRAARIRPEFLAAARLHLVEMSPVLRARQREQLATVGQVPTWHDRLATVPRMPLLLIANEFFDALPIRQFVRTASGWRERVVGLDADGNLAFGIGPGGLLDAEVPAAVANAGEGALLEVSPASTAIMAEIAHRIREHGTAALVIDYGYARTGIGDTLQSVRRHAYVDPLADPGEVDLTAHVNFEVLARTARSEGVAVAGPMEQGEFLLRLGLVERAGRLGAGRPTPVQDEIRAAVERLAGPVEMGSLFKVLAITAPGLKPPPFDDNA
ncbi:MAG: class I SAM-dependent methyltransferase [Hyphomicrobiales bacterium]